jgi:hypothetical protein
MNPSRLFRLDDNTSGFGLSCDAEGLALAGVPLLCKGVAGFEPRTRGEINALLTHANIGRKHPLTLTASGLNAVADALNQGDLAKAQIAAVFMRVPELDANSIVRMILADAALSKFNPDQPRDDHGRWTTSDGTMVTDAASADAPAAHPQSNAAPSETQRDDPPNAGTRLPGVPETILAAITGDNRMQPICLRAKNICLANRLFLSRSGLAPANDNSAGIFYRCDTAYDECLLVQAVHQLNAGFGNVVFPDGTSVNFLPGRPPKLIASPRFRPPNRV